MATRTEVQDVRQAVALVRQASEALTEAGALLKPHRNDPGLYQARCLVTATGAKIALAHLRQWLGENGGEHDGA